MSDRLPSRLCFPCAIGKNLVDCSQPLINRRQAMQSGSVLKVKLAALLGALAVSSVFAAEVSSDDALCAVKGWVNLKEALGGDFDANPASVTAYDGEDGKGKFYVVTLEGGGYVVASGDDEVTPILAYSREFGAFWPAAPQTRRRGLRHQRLAAGVSRHPPLRPPATRRSGAAFARRAVRTAASCGLASRPPRRRTCASPSCSTPTGRRAASATTAELPIPTASTCTRR